MGKVIGSTEKSIQILNAATKVLSVHGYAGSTVSRVVEEAQVARGLVHYYFKNKEDMLAKVLRANMENSMELIAPLFENCQSAEELSKRMVNQLKEMLKNNPDYFNLFVEGIAVSRHSEAVRQALDALYEDLKISLQSGLEKLVGEGTIHPTIPNSGLAFLLAALLDGMGVQFVSLKGTLIENDTWESMEKALVLLLK